MPQYIFCVIFHEAFFFVESRTFFSQRVLEGRCYRTFKPVLGELLVELPAGDIGNTEHRFKWQVFSLVFTPQSIKAG